VIEDAGYDPQTPWDSTEFTEFWYPYECQVGAAFCMEDGQASFTPCTTPNSDGYSSYSGIWVTNISTSGDMMTFDFYTEADPPVFADIYRWPDTNFTGPYPVYTIILDTFGIQTDSLYYSINNAGFIPVPNDSVQGDTQYWYQITHIATLGDSITYYIAATDSMMNRQTSGFYQFRIVETGIQELVNGTESNASFHVYQNNPNPFTRSTVIDYQMTMAAYISVKVYNVTGELIRTLIEDYQAPGTYQVRWDGNDAQGRQLPQGTYFCCLRVGEEIETRPMVLVR
jgi:hypothetical protein